ncbi:hypothetical protein [Stenotrophomonas rhizophila]|uniref:hypothetical protein n=1 Tax=Stenotrophomonas rhizophila TaxID=216778 RepID=UPI00112F7784|nr:hypothetical protein [Stenotrophomonas rhizophila]
MHKIKVRVRQGIGQQSAGRLMSMLRAFALSLEGFQVLAGKTNRALFSKRYLVFCFSSKARAEAFRQCGRERMGDVFTFHRRPRRSITGSHRTDIS